MTRTADLRTRTAGAGAVALAAILWALIGVYSRELGARGVGPPEVAFWRALGGGACFAIHHAVARRRSIDPPALLRRCDWARLVSFALICVSVFFAALPQAVESGGITVAYVLLYTAPVWVTIGARLWLGERTDNRSWALVLITVVGVVLVVLGGGSSGSVTVAAVVWGLAAGVSYSGYYLLGRGLFDTVGIVRTFAIALPLGSIPLLIAADLSVPTRHELVLLIGLIVGSTWLPYLLLGHGLRTVASSRAVVVATVEPVVAAVLGATLYQERLGVWAWLGGGMVVIAAGLAGRVRE